MKKTILRASAGFQALALMGAGITAGFVATAPAAAQDYTAGAVSGTVSDEAGAPVAGANVTLRSVAQGQVRTFTTGTNGVFNASGLAPGQYVLSVDANGFSPSEDVITVAPSVSSTVTVSLLAASTTDSGDVIVVRGRARQIQTQGATGLAIDVPTITQNIAVPRDVTGVTLLAPTTARSHTGFTSTSGEAVPTIGGGSAAENAYYINGLNITNPDTYIGSALVPFEFFKTVDVQTGGYPAEFGRATGGVVNSTTKSGTNIPFAGLHINWQPSSLQSHSPNTGQATNPTIVGKETNTTRRELTLEAGGAIVPDHLFFYGLIQARRNVYESAGQRSATYRKQIDNDPIWGAKVDAYITPTQHAEFTIFDTRTVTDDNAYLYQSTKDDFSDGVIGTPDLRKIERGGLNWVGRYTGDVSDFLTLSAAYGISRDRQNFLPANADAYYVVDTSEGNADRLSLNQPFLTSNKLETKRRFYRADADLRVTLAGEHRFRFGFDNEDLSEEKLTFINGSLPIEYVYDENGVLLTYERLGGAISARNTAFYAQDSWSTPLDGLTLNLGIRDDIFKQYNLSDEIYADLKNNIGLRIGFNYVPSGMNQWRFFGNYGRYYIPPAMNLGFRGRDLFFSQYFHYPTHYDRSSLTVDPQTGLPTVSRLDPFTEADLIDTGLDGDGYLLFCPAGVLGGAPGNPQASNEAVCQVNGAGVQDPALAKFARSAKATNEDEFILGTRYRMNSLLTIGLQGTYRKLNKISEDSDFRTYYVDYWCGPDGGLTGAKDADACGFYLANSAYHIWNVGDDSIDVNDFYYATLGEAVPVTLTGLGNDFPKARRTFKAIVLDFNRADDGRWFAGGSLTWSKAKGNYEGTVRSDVGNGVQSDAGATIDFDYPGLADNAYGYLSGDHRYTMKLFGAYHFNKMFTLGANILVQSPGHGSCLGIHPTDSSAGGYGPLSFFCGTGTIGTDSKGREYYPSNVASPRGTGFKTDWLRQVDLSARFKVPYGAGDQRFVQLKADVFNVFNSHAVIQRNGVSETSGGAPGGGYYRSLLFLTPNAYQTPRYVRLGLDVMFGGAPAVEPVEEVVAPPPPPPPAPAPATQTCADGTVILATDACPVPPPPAPPAPAPERG